MHKCVTLTQPNVNIAFSDVVLLANVCFLSESNVNDNGNIVR